MKEANNGVGQPEVSRLVLEIDDRKLTVKDSQMRLKIVIPMLVLPPSLIAYAWLVDQNQSVWKTQSHFGNN